MQSQPSPSGRTNQPSVRVALAHANDAIVERIASRLKDAPGQVPFEVCRVPSLDELVRSARGGEYSVAIVALDFEGRDGRAVVVMLQEGAPELPVIMVERADSDLGLEAVNLGARDCLSEAETDSPRLAKAIRFALLQQDRRNRARNDVVRFDNLLENIPERIYFKDRASRFVRVNRAMADLFQLTHADDMIGKTDFDFFTEEHARPAYEDEQLLITEREARISKVEKETFPDGRFQWALTTKMPLRSPDGRIIGTFGISHDITQLRETEHALEQERNQLRLTGAQLTETNRQMAADLDMARMLQLALLPRDYPTFPPEADAASSLLRFDHRYLPVHTVAGDFFAIYPVSATKAGILLCDVMGHGPRAALVTAIIRTLGEELRARAGNPGDFIGGLNAGLCKVLGDLEDPMFCSGVYAVVDSTSSVVEFSNAGHPSPIHLNRRDRTAFPLSHYDERKGHVLGIFPREVFPTCRFELHPSDVLLLFTDGVFEVLCKDNAEFGPERLMRQLETAANLDTAALLDATLEAVRQRAQTGFEDDVCIVSVERVAPPA